MLSSGEAKPMHGTHLLDGWALQSQSADICVPYIGVAPDDKWSKHKQETRAMYRVAFGRWSIVKSQRRNVRPMHRGWLQATNRQHQRILEHKQGPMYRVSVSRLSFVKSTPRNMRPIHWGFLQTTHSQSKPRIKPCPEYLITGKDSLKNIQLYFKRCDSVATLQKVIVK